ncbi:MAG: hypothetical protein ACKV2T_15770 [Kofleriaceae bacterium]
MMDANTSVPDLNAGKNKWLVRIMIASGVGLAIGGGYVAYKYLTHEVGGRACARLDELANSDPDGARAAVENLVRYVETRITNLDHDRITIDAEGNHDRCVASLEKIEKVLMHGQFTRVVDCIATARDARAARLCI